MQIRWISRRPGALQEPLADHVVVQICRRAFGRTSRVTAVTELGWGTYNTVCRVDLDQSSVVLRVAPPDERQLNVERRLLRNSHAAAPYLAPLGDLLPHTLFADFTRQLIDRDYLVQTILPGVPAPDWMARHPRSRWSELFRQIGVVTSEIHRVAGEHFGAIGGRPGPVWSEVLLDYLRLATEDLADAGDDPADVAELAGLAEGVVAVLDEVTEPRLLHGDGWTSNFLLDPDNPQATITGVCDWDRAIWGDPLADWGIQRALSRPGTERDAFWDGYSQPRPDPTNPRQLIYRARMLVELRLAATRSGDYEASRAHRAELAPVIDQLRSL